MDDEDKPFEGIIGNSSEVVVLEHLLSCPSFTFNITELSQTLTLSRPTITTIIQRLLKWEMITIEKEIGKIKLYKINEKSNIINNLDNVSNDIITLIEKYEIAPKYKSYASADNVFIVTGLGSESDELTNETSIDTVDSGYCSIKKPIESVDVTS